MLMSVVAACAFPYFAARIVHRPLPPKPCNAGRPSHLKRIRANRLRTNTVIASGGQQWLWLPPPLPFLYGALSMSSSSSLSFFSSPSSSRASVLVSDSVVMALSIVFHSINSPDNSPLSHSPLPVLSLPYWSFQLYISL